MEAQALAIALSKIGVASGSRIVAYVDNQATIGAIRRGYSMSYELHPVIANP